MRVFVDKMRCQQILINLLSNAIKFSKPLDTIEVWIQKPKNQKGSTWQFEISVTDQGIGLCDSDRANLFTPYFRSTDPENRERNLHSNGIGLNFSKRLANSVLNGDLKLSDDYRDGCSFILTMSLERHDKKRQSTYKLRNGQEFGKKKPGNKVRRSNGLAHIYELRDESLNSEEFI